MTGVWNSLTHSRAMRDGCLTEIAQCMKRLGSDGGHILLYLMQTSFDEAQRRADSL